MSRSKVSVKICVLHEYQLQRSVSISFNLMMAVVAGFHCDVVSCKIARQGERRGAAETWSPAHVQGVVTQSV